MRTAVYAGSFDPITRGHEDLIRRSLAFVDRLVVAVATNSSKQPLFTLDERVAFIREAVGNDARVDVQQFNGLLVDFARGVGANLIIRGLRAARDLRSSTNVGDATDESMFMRSAHFCLSRSAAATAG